MLSNLTKHKSLKHKIIDGSKVVEKIDSSFSVNWLNLILAKIRKLSLSISEVSWPKVFKWLREYP